MNKNSNISKELSAHPVGRHLARNPLPHWRIVSSALMLALILGSVGQPVPARAAPAGELVNFSMTVINPKTTLKCGETVTYIVKVELAQTGANLPTAAPGPPGSRKGLSVINIKVDAYSKDTSVGDFVDAVKGMATKTTTVVFDDDLATLGTKFKFKAGEKPGKTILYFEGLVKGEYVSFDLPVKVIPCKEKVNMILEFPVPGLYNITVLSDEALMTPDENGNYTGKASMYWVYSNIIAAPCSKMTVSATDSQVDLTGHLDDDGGQFVATGTFQPTTISLSVTCPPTGTHSPPSQKGTVNPLTFTVASAGGVSTQTVTAGNISGTARIVVVPEEDQAAAFNPGNHEASWNDFLSLYGALLALR